MNVELYDGKIIVFGDHGFKIFRKSQRTFGQSSVLYKNIIRIGSIEIFMLSCEFEMECLTLEYPLTFSTLTIKTSKTEDIHTIRNKIIDEYNKECEQKDIILGIHENLDEEKKSEHT